MPLVAEHLASTRNDLATMIVSEAERTRKQVSAIGRDIKRHLDQRLNQVLAAQTWAYVHPPVVTVQRSKLPQSLLDDLDAGRLLADLSPTQVPSQQLLTRIDKGEWSGGLLEADSLFPASAIREAGGASDSSSELASPSTGLSAVPVVQGSTRAADCWPAKPYNESITSIQDAWREWSMVLTLDLLSVN